jgi:hypothetical protein
MWMMHITSEAESKGYVRNAALQALENETEREALDATMTRWDGLFGTEEKEIEGSLKVAVDAGDLTAARNLIKEMYNITKTWLVICSSGLSEEAQRMQGKLKGISYRPSTKLKVDPPPLTPGSQVRRSQTPKAQSNRGVASRKLAGPKDLPPPRR